MVARGSINYEIDVFRGSQVSIETNGQATDNSIVNFQIRKATNDLIELNLTGSAGAYLVENPNIQYPTRNVQ